MHLQIFSIYDSKTEAFMTPFFSPTIASAMRSIATIAREPEHQFNLYGEDYALFHIGMFNSDSGFIERKTSPVNLGLVMTFNGPAELKEANS